MGFGNCILANDVPEHREVLNEAGIFFQNNIRDLTNKMQYLLDNPQIIEKLGKKALKRVKEKYTWYTVTNSYEKLFKKLKSHKK